jgi:hypothetical protein
LESGDQAGWGQMVGLTGLLPAETIRQWGDDYTRELASIYMRMRGHEQWEIDLAVQAFKNSWDDRVQKVQDSSKDIKTTQQSIADDAKNIYNEWRSFAGGLLQATQVTPEDMALTDVGAYEDKWDEYVRRLRAAQTDMQSVFRKMLPTDIEQAGQESINAWVKQQEEMFYAGMMPDKVNWEALIADYDRALGREMGKERLLDIFLQKLAESGRTPDEYAAKKALGLDSPIKAMFFGGMRPEDVGTDIQADLGIVAQAVSVTPEMVAPAAQSFASGLSGGLQTAFSAVPWTDPVVTAFNNDLSKKQAEVRKIGETIGYYLFDGLEAEMAEYSIVAVIKAQVMAEVEKALAELD